MPLVVTARRIAATRASPSTLPTSATFGSTRNLFGVVKGFSVTRSAACHTFSFSRTPLLGLGGGRQRFTPRCLELFELFEALRPIGFEQAGEPAIGEQFSAGLTLRTVVELVVRVGDALHRRAAHRAGFLEATVDGHFRAECGHFFGEARAHFHAQAR